MNDLYPFPMIKADSDRALAAWKARWWVRFEQGTEKMRKANQKYFGIPIKCLLAAGAITVLSVNGFV